MVDIGTTTSYLLTGLASGTWHVMVTAYDTTYNPTNDDPATIVNDNITNGNESWFASGKAPQVGLHSIFLLKSAS